MGLKISEADMKKWISIIITQTVKPGNFVPSGNAKEFVFLFYHLLYNAMMTQLSMVRMH